MMFTHLAASNFKSWRTLPDVRLAPITGLFGSNSSGKTSILQLFLMLKQTSESIDRSQALEFGNDKTPTQLGSLTDVLYGHDLSNSLQIGVSWRPAAPLRPTDPTTLDTVLFEADEVTLNTRFVVDRNKKTPIVDELSYSAGDMTVSLKKSDGKAKSRPVEYNMSAQLRGTEHLIRRPGRPWPLPAPLKYYAFPNEAVAYYQNSGFLSDLELEVDKQFGSRTFYLGPLREHPARQYRWQGSRPTDVGSRGENTVEALLASRDGGRLNTRGYDSRGRAKRRITVEEHVAAWLQELSLVHEFEVQQLSQDADIYRVFVRRTKDSPQVLLTDVGFGVSQVLPVLTLLAYVPEGSTVLLEQPEIHLHPAVQTALADVLIEVATVRRVQVILESHSEHMLRRIQLRIAEEHLTSDSVALYFCELHEGASRLRELSVNEFGEIQEWPRDFFGNPTQEALSFARAVIAAKRAQN